jgi:hypothetical protein
MPAFMRRLAALCAALAIGVFSAVPPEHVHRMQDSEHGHDHLVVHRHLQAHHVVRHDAEHRPSLDDDDAAVTLDVPFTAPAAARTLHAPPVVARLLLTPPRQMIATGTARYVERLIHGPPRATAALRAPPATTRL